MQNETNPNIPNLKYNFHDSHLVDFQIGPRRELVLRIALYEIYYKGCPVVTVRFGAIANFERVQTFFEQFVKPDETGEYLERLDALRYDERNQSLKDKLFFYLQFDWTGSVTIHCGKLNVSDIN